MAHNPLISTELLVGLVALARRAGDAIMAIYAHPEEYAVSHKLDDSPLTAADMAAHHIIMAGLAELLPVPVISEESPLPDYAERAQWPYYWLVDPLDGTKEFIARNGQFTVNIALVKGQRSILGAVYHPAQDNCYLGVLEAADAAWVGAWKYHAKGQPQALQVRALGPRYQQQQPLTLLMSQRHGAAAAAELQAKLAQRWPGPLETSNAGSSLKFCMIAEGLADFYPRLAPTSEWDTAAAQAVLEAAGGALVQASAGLPALVYNSRATILNPHFYALGDRQFDWAQLLSDQGLHRR